MITKISNWLPLQLSAGPCKLLLIAECLQAGAGQLIQHSTTSPKITDTKNSEKQQQKTLQKFTAVDFKQTRLLVPN